MLRHQSNNYYNELLNMQGGLCALCGEKETRQYIDKKSGKNKYYKLSVDHNHTSGNIRGLLCGICNNIVSRIENGHCISAKMKKLKPNVTFDKVKKWIESDGIKFGFEEYLRLNFGNNLTLPKRKITKIKMQQLR